MEENVDPGMDEVVVLTIAHLPAGLYLLKTFPGGDVRTVKLVKN